MGRPRDAPPLAQVLAQHVRPHRHIWVTTPDGDACPGLLIQWQRRGRDWWAHAIWIPEDGIAVQQWLPADKVRPA